MAGVVRFNVDLQVRGAENLAAMESRVRDASPLFRAIVDYWASHNELKFMASVGFEVSGAQMDDNLFWQPLTEAYRKSKRRRGQPDQIMKATGDLFRSLSSPDTIFEMVTPEDVTFGSPLDPDDVKKVHYNWKSRQAIFLGRADRDAIEKMVGDFLNRRGEFAIKSSDAGLEAVRLRQEAAQMDMDFENTVQNDTGVW